MSIGGKDVNGSSVANVYLVDLDTGKACLQSQLPEGMQGAQVHTFRKRLLVCSSNSTMKCFMYSPSNGWECFAPPADNAINGTFNSVRIPGKGIWFFDEEGDSMLLDETTGAWDTTFAYVFSQVRSGSCVLQISDTKTAHIGGSGAYGVRHIIK